MKITAHFGPAVTLSIPAIISAEKIVVIAE